MKNSSLLNRSFLPLVATFVSLILFGCSSGSSGTGSQAPQLKLAATQVASSVSESVTSTVIADNLTSDGKTYMYYTVSNESLVYVETINADGTLSQPVSSGVDSGSYLPLRVARDRRNRTGLDRDTFYLITRNDSSNSAQLLKYAAQDDGSLVQTAAVDVDSQVDDIVVGDDKLYLTSTTGVVYSYTSSLESGNSVNLGEPVTALELSEDGHYLYATKPSSNLISEITITGDTMSYSSLGDVSSKGLTPVGLTSSGNNVYVTNEGSNTLVHFYNHDGVLEYLGSYLTTNNPSGVVAVGGYVYQISDDNSYTLSLFVQDSEGDLVLLQQLPSLNQPAISTNLPSFFRRLPSINVRSVRNIFTSQQNTRVITNIVNSTRISSFLF